MPRYKDVCPSCGGNSLYTKGFKYCFKCGHTELPEGFQRREHQSPYNTIILQALYNTISSEYQKELQRRPKVIEYLKQRGLTEQDIETYQLGYCPSGFLSVYKEHHQSFIDGGLGYVKDGVYTCYLAGSITFPYLVRGNVSDIRGRVVRKDGKYRFTSLANSAKLRGARFAYNYREEELDTVYITEGELKTVVLQHVVEDTRTNACGLPGITNIRKLPKAKQYGILLDTDPDFTQIVKSVYSITQQLERQGVERHNVFATRLPSIFGKGVKVGVDDYILAGKDVSTLAFHQVDQWFSLVR